MTGPLLNGNCDRRPAGHELALLVVTAWELAVKMNTERITFQIYFPATADKFSASTMTAKDTNVSAMQLQLQQCRLKLVITPVVTIRDDRGLTIMAKNILSADVLIMA